MTSTVAVIAADRLQQQLAEVRNLLTAGQLQPAAQLLDDLLAINPENPGLLHALATLRAAQWRNDDAISTLQQAITLHPDNAGLYYELGLQYLELGLTAEALEYHRRAAELAPDRPEFKQPLAALLLRLGEFDQAGALLEQNIRQFPDYKRLYVDLAMCGRRQADDPLFTAIHAQLTEATIPRPEKAHLHFALVKLYNDLGESKRAFHHAVVGNRLSGRDFDHQRHTDWVNQIINQYPQTPAVAESPGTNVPTPVFIVGMPRSGTSLVEQILSSHPQICGAGESVLLARLDREAAAISGKGSYPAYGGSLDPAVGNRLARHYLQRLNRVNHDEPPASHLTDKQPTNFHYVGLIFELFPNARVVHCQRHPLDVVLSCYQQDFVSPTMNFTFSLNKLAHYYATYQQLMNHWQRLFGEKILQLDYQHLVEEPERQARRLIDYLDLPWDKACLQFHTNRRGVRTASLAQVRRPLYRDSLDRWRELQTELQPAAEIIGVELPKQA